MLHLPFVPFGRANNTVAISASGSVHVVLELFHDALDPRNAFLAG
jgi:hypothetical protein